MFGEAADFGTPAGCAALAAFMSGGSLAPPEAPRRSAGRVHDGEGRVGQRHARRRRRPSPERADEKFEEFITSGLEVADRTKLWAA